MHSKMKTRAWCKSCFAAFHSSGRCEWHPWYTMRPDKRKQNPVSGVQSMDGAQRPHVLERMAKTFAEISRRIDLYPSSCHGWSGSTEMFGSAFANVYIESTVAMTIKLVAIYVTPFLCHICSCLRACHAISFVHFTRRRRLKT